MVMKRPVRPVSPPPPQNVNTTLTVVLMIPTMFVIKM